METHNCLGIYISRQTATVVCVEGRGVDAGVAGCFSVSVEQDQQGDFNALAGLISEGCAERQWNDREATVALDCALFMQHSIRSEFTEARRIAATVRFDTEDALATDASDMAIAFEVTSQDDVGSDLTVFTAHKDTLSDLLTALQSHGIDPVAVEPDVTCLTGFVMQKLSPGTSDTLFAMLSKQNGYIVSPPTGEGKGATNETVRTFLIGAKQDRAQVLQREVLMTTALAKHPSPGRLALLDTRNGVDPETLAGRIGMDVSTIDLAEVAGAHAEQADPVEFALACGAALDVLSGRHEVNFRDDFMPYQGRRMRLQSAVKFFSISVTILLIAVGLYFQIQHLRASRYNTQIRSKLAQDYLAVTGQRLPTRESVKTKLNDEIRRLKKQKAGGLRNPGEDTSLSARLTLILGAVNNVAASTDVEIETISVAERSMSVVGSASNKSGTLKFESALKATGLGDVSGNYSVKQGRDQFRLSINPK